MSHRRSTLGLGFLFGAMYFIQGIAEPTEGLIAQPVRSLLKNWGLSTTAIGGFMALLSLPWSIKPLYGLMSDFLPIFGSRRRSYLLLTSAAATFGLTAIYLLPLSADAVGLLFWLLLVPTIGVAFSDVVIDALMVEVGQPRGLTGRFQSIQWAAIYAATILTTYVGGWLSQHKHQQWAFLICAIASAISLMLVIVSVREPHGAGPRESFGQTARALRAAVAQPAVLVTIAFLFLWNFNPFSATVLYIYQTEELHLSEQFHGNSQSVYAATAVLASISYGLYSRRVPFRWLLHTSIVAGILATLVYLALSGPTSAMIAAALAGFTYMTGNLIQLDLAARVCPPQVAGTVFATLMAVCNLGYTLSAALGGWLYDLFSTDRGPHVAFDVLVLIGAACTAACWLLLPWVRRATE